MPDNTEALILQMSADLKRLEKSYAQARGITNRTTKSIEDRFDKMNNRIRRSGDDMARDIRASLAAIGVGAAIREVTTYADVWTTARNKLAAAGVEQGKLAATMQDLVGLAQATRSGFGETVDLYAKLTRAGEKLALSQEQIRKITETTLQAFVAGGAAASEQAAAITQLSQALGSGVLQGDELKSIRENAPLLAQAIANEFNTTIAGLKDLGAEGELTADRVAKAILNADGITEAFGQTISTVAQAVTNLQTAFTRYIAESRVAQGLMQTLGGFIQFVTDNIDLLADAALIAAGVIGGTLAAQAIGRFVSALRLARTEAAAAGVQFGILRASMTFLSGPLGAIILGIGGALLSMATNTREAASAADRAAEAFGNVSKIQSEMEANQKALVAAQDKLTEAIRNGGEAARIASTLEVERIRKNLAGNKAMLDVEKARAAIAVRDREREFQTKRVPLPFLSEDQNRAMFGENGGLPLAAIYGSFALPELSKRGQSGEQFVAQMAIKAQTKELTENEAALLKVVSAAIAYDEEIAGLQESLRQLNAIQLDLGDEQFITDMPGTEVKKGAGSDGGAASVKGYRTELEKLKDTLGDLRDARQADVDVINQATFALDSYNQMANADADHEAEYFAERARRVDQLDKIEEEASQKRAARSREAVQAVLDFANGGDLAAAFAQVPSILDLLVGDDEVLLRTKLTQLASDAADGVAVGVDKIAADFVKAYEEIEKAEAAAIAAGVTDLSQFARARQELFDTLDATLEERTAVPNPYDIDALAAEQKGFIDDLDFEIIGEEFRQIMRDSLKNAMREGIRTGDWSDSFSMILADAVTAGLDDALNRVGDWLADFLFGQGGLLDGIIAGAGNFIGMSLFGRASGGPVYGGQMIKVGENGPEILRMGRGQSGQILNASTTRDMLKGGGGAGSIYAPLIVQGSVDAVTWPSLQAAMQRQTRLIMSAVPATVNATITTNRKQQRKI